MGFRPKVYKTSVNLTEDAVKALEQIAKARNKTVAEVIRQAISTEKFLFDTTSTGGKVLIEEPDRNLRQLVFR